MEKKYQVFISSTYRDLIEERTAVTQCLLEMGCIPVGMEQFPASNISQMEYIKMLLDDCDYYVLILAGKYGSLDSDGVGFTEKEYNYAVEKGIPIMSFVFRDIGRLASNKCEETEEGRQKLNNFRGKVCGGKLVRFYDDCGTLQASVAISLNRCIQDFPATGWIRGNNVETPIDIEEKIEKYMQEHTVIIDGGDASSHGKEKPPESSSDTVSLVGARVALEELAKKMPKIEWGEF